MWATFGPLYLSGNKDNDSCTPVQTAATYHILLVVRAGGERGGGGRAREIFYHHHFRLRVFVNTGRPAGAHSRHMSPPLLVEFNTSANVTQLVVL